MNQETKHLKLFLRCVELGVKVNELKICAVICTQGVNTFNVVINSPTDVRIFNDNNLEMAVNYLTDILAGKAYIPAAGQETKSKELSELFSVIGTKFKESKKK